jgi:hypothetical protein
MMTLSAMPAFAPVDMLFWSDAGLVNEDVVGTWLKVVIVANHVSMKMLSMRRCLPV